MVTQKGHLYLVTQTSKTSLLYRENNVKTTQHQYLWQTSAVRVCVCVCVCGSLQKSLIKVHMYHIASHAFIFLATLYLYLLSILCLYLRVLRYVVVLHSMLQVVLAIISSRTTTKHNNSRR